MAVVVARAVVHVVFVGARPTLTATSERNDVRTEDCLELRVVLHNPNQDQLCQGGTFPPSFRGRTVAKPALATLIVLSTILVSVPFIAPFTVPFFNI